MMAAQGMEAGGVLGVNADDPERPAYERLPLPPGWTLMLVPAGTTGSSEVFRQAFRRFPDRPWYGNIADDNGIGTAGFEQALVSAAGGWGIASANDGWQARADVMVGRMHGATVIGGELMRALGYWAPEGFHHLFLDDVWETIGRELGVWRTLMDVHTPHHHPVNTGQAMDATHVIVNSNTMHARDGARFRRWLAEEWPGDRRRVRQAQWAAQGLSLDRARSRSVLLGFPDADRIGHRQAAAAMATVALLGELGIRHGWMHVDQLPVHQACNRIATGFLASDWSDLVLIDAALVWKPWDLVRLLASPSPLIGAAARRPDLSDDSDPAGWGVAPVPEHHGSFIGTAAGSVEVAEVGASLLRVNRSVFTALCEARPVARIVDRATGQPGWTFFGWDDDGLNVTSGLCRRWRALGGQVWVDTTITLHRMDQTERHMRFVDLLRPQ
ncbi:MAG TPA: hypothetical protein VED21_03415 [Azospirillum sp.]|nr:hypothetical protein [Azospirillum sp.]